MSSVTVIIVTWRRHEMLRRAIRSALDQTHRDLSILVVNDDP
jgi:glycosyltransferase involved in cell wall biosynthesis